MQLFFRSLTLYYAFALSVDVVAEVIATKRVFCLAIHSKKRYDPANLLLCVGVLFFQTGSLFRHTMISI